MQKGFLILCVCLCLAQTEPKRAAEINLIQKGQTFKGTIHVNGKPYYLNLKAAERSVFASDFKLTTPEEGPNGKTIFRDITPSKRELFEMERKVYSDVDSGAATQIHHEQGELRVHGILDNMHISNDGRSHFALIHENMGPNHARIADYVDQPEGSKNKRSVLKRGKERRADMKEFSVETYYIVDNALWIQLGSTNAAIANYLQLMTRAVNNRFATSKDPLFVFQITGAGVMTTPSKQASFIGACPAKPGSNAYDMDCTIDKFGEYMALKMDRLKKHDVAALLSGAHWMTEDSNGTWESDTHGLAYVKGACRAESTMSYKISVTWDKDAPFAGSLSLAHEFAHNLGSHHDGAEGSEHCHWQDDYLMSHTGWGTTNKLFFSKCSLESMKEYANSEYGKCLRTQNEPASPWVGKKEDLGDLYNMAAQCRRLLGMSNATVFEESTPDELCRNLKCQYLTKCSYNDGWCTLKWEAKQPAFDNTVCDTGKKCKYGKCTLSIKNLVG